MLLGLLVYNVVSEHGSLQLSFSMGKLLVDLVTLDILVIGQRKMAVTYSSLKQASEAGHLVQYKG